MKPKVKVKAKKSQNQNVAHCDPKIYPQTKFDISNSNNIGDIIWNFSRTEARGQRRGHSDTGTIHDSMRSKDVSTHQLWDSYVK